MSLRILAQFVKAFHGAKLDGRLAGHGDEPAELVHRAGVFDLEDEVFVAGVVDENGFLGGFIDVFVFVPDELGRDETAVGRGPVAWAKRRMAAAKKKSRFMLSNLE